MRETGVGVESYGERMRSQAVVQVLELLDAWRVHAVYSCEVDRGNRFPCPILKNSNKTSRRFTLCFANANVQHFGF